MTIAMTPQINQRINVTAPVGVVQQAFDNAVDWCIKYTGQSNFINSLSAQLRSGKSLSVKQKHALMNSYSKSKVVGGSKIQLRSNTPDPTTYPEATKIASWLVAYNGTFTFLLNMQADLKKHGLTVAQWAGVIKCYNNDQKRQPASGQMVMFNKPVPVIINRSAAMMIKKQLNTSYGPFALEVLGCIPTKSRKTLYKVRINSTGAVNVCRVCGKSLVDYKSIVSGIGPVCAKTHLGSMYVTYKADIQKFMAQWAAECAKIGEFDVMLGNWNFKEGLNTVISTASATVSAPPTINSNNTAPLPKMYGTAHNISVGQIFEGKHINLWLHPTTGYNWLNDKGQWTAAIESKNIPGPTLFDDDQEYTVMTIKDTTDALGNVVTVINFRGHDNINIACTGFSSYVLDVCKGLQIYTNSTNAKWNDCITVTKNSMGNVLMTLDASKIEKLAPSTITHVANYAWPLLSLTNHGTGRMVSFKAELNTWYEEKHFPNKELLTYTANVDGNLVTLTIKNIK